MNQEPTGSVEYKHHTLSESVKTKDGIYAWFYDNGTERFPGITFPTFEEAMEYKAKINGRTYLRFQSNH